MTENEKLRLLAKDLTRDYPRSPRETLAGYVIAARTLDKCRAVVAGTQGEYHFNCPLDRQFLDFTGIDADQFKTFAATGATDAEVAAWIEQHSKVKEGAEIVAWNAPAISSPAGHLNFDASRRECDPPAGRRIGFPRCVGGHILSHHG